MGLFENADECRDREALAWVRALHGDGMSDEQMDEYLEWMEADPANAMAFRSLDAAWIAAADSQDQLRAQFSAEAHSNGPDSLPARLSKWFVAAPSVRYAGAIAAACIALLIFVPGPEPEIPSQQFVTMVGDQRDVALPDGSTATLNTNTMLTVSYEGERRIVSLRRGQALFDVTTDVQRPFVVNLDGGFVEVLGTVFDIRKTEDGFFVTVLEGRVSVGIAGTGEIDKAVVLTPDQRAEVDVRNQEVSLVDVDAEAELAWRRGQLIYRNTDLRAVIDDLNRYSSVPIDMSSNDIGANLFTGVIAVSEPKLMADRLAGLLDMEVVETDAGALQLRPIDD